MKSLQFWVASGIALGSLAITSPASAQPIPDATLPVNSVVKSCSLPKRLARPSTFLGCLPRLAIVIDLTLRLNRYWRRFTSQQREQIAITSNSNRCL